MEHILKAAIILAAAVFSVTGCGNAGSMAPKLSPAEKSLIGRTGIMRVLTVDNREDSLLLRSECSDFRARDLKSKTFKVLSERMIATVTDPSQDGVGIAGPQVGLKRRVVAVMRYDKPGTPFEIYPNIHIEPVVSGYNDYHTKLLTMIAGLIPARFAAKRDPVEALRTE